MPINEKLNFKGLSQRLESLSANILPPELKETVILRGFSLLRIPLIAFLGPRVELINEQRVDISIPLGYRSKNHLGCMYFGALAAGADLALGYMAFREFHKRNLRLEIIFKNFQADFIKRAKADVTFTCEQGDALRAMIEDCLQTTERITREFEVIATTPSLTGSEPIARFRMGLSMKNRAS